LDGDNELTPKELGDKADRILARQVARKENVVVNAIETTEVNAMRAKRDFKKTDTFEGGICFVHRKFGKDAYTCRGAPCTMIGQTKPRPAGNDKAGHK
jgi:hypothetical protein